MQWIYDYGKISNVCYNANEEDSYKLMNRQCLSEFRNKHGWFFTILNYCVLVLLGIFIFCRPIPHMTAIMNISFYLAIVIALFLMILNPGFFAFKAPFTYPLIVFFLWSLLSIFWALNIENTINDVRGHLLNHIIFYFLIINFFHSRKRLETLAWIVVLTAVFFSVIGIVYYYVIIGNQVQSIRLGYLVSNLDNVSTELPVNFIGTLNITAIFFCLYFFSRPSFLCSRIAIILCALVSFVAIFLTQSRGSLVALVFAGSTMLVLIRKKKLLPIFLIAISVVIFLTPFKDRIDKASLIERFKINYVAFEVLKDYPLKGIGFGMMTFNSNINKKVYINKLPEKFRPADIFTPHNWLLDITVRLGLIGLILFLTILFVFVKMCWETIRHAKDDGIRLCGMCVAMAFLAYFVMGLVEPLFLFRASAMMFYIFLGMITILLRLNHETEAIEAQPVDEK